MTRQLYEHSRTAPHLTQVSVWEAGTNPSSLCWPPPSPFIVWDTPVPSPDRLLPAGCHHTCPSQLLGPHLSPSYCVFASVFPLVCLPPSTVLPEGGLAVTLMPGVGHQPSMSGSGSPTSQTTLTLQCFIIFYEACFPGTGHFICINLNFKLNFPSEIPST